MSKTAFDKIAAGLSDAIAIASGDADPASYRVHVPETIDVRALRARLKMSQAKFASSFGLAIRSVQEWEQGRKTPEPSTRILLRIIEREPEAVKRALEVV